MEKYKDIVNKINLIIEQSDNECPKCKNCISHCDGACTFGCVNERSMGKYMFSQRKLTSPDYSCDNFKPVYSLNENNLKITQINVITTILTAFINKLVLKSVAIKSYDLPLINSQTTALNISNIHID